MLSWNNSQTHPHSAKTLSSFLINYLMLVHMYQTNVWYFNLFPISLMHMLLLTLKFVILKLFLLFTRLGLWLSWKKRYWKNAHNTTVITLRLLLLRKIIFLLLLIFVLVVTTTVTPTVEVGVVV